MNTYFTEMEAGELAGIDGGSFAYDAGRVVRFLLVGAGSFGTNPSAAVVDWYGISLI